MPRKKTHEEFCKEVFELVGDEYVVLGQYVSTHKNIKIRHKECENEYDVRPSNFLKENGTRCPECFGNKKLTAEEFVCRVFEQVGNEYTVLGEYVNTKTYIAMKHNTCGHEFPVKPEKFIGKGTRCPACFGKKRKTHDKFIKEVFDAVGEEYTVLTEYTNSDTHIGMKHNACGHRYNVTPDKFLSGRRCPECFGKTKKTHEEFAKAVFDAVGEEYTVLDEYVGMATKIKFRHNACGHEYMITPYSFISNGSRCVECTGYRKKTHEEFIKEVFDAVENEYTVLEEYVVRQAHLKFKHNLCGHIYKVTPANFSKGHRCPKCNESKGEKSISTWLKNNNIPYQAQYRFNNCKYKNTLPFDFAVFNDGKLETLIEYDGKQHFEPVAMFGGEKEFKARQLKDGIKNRYCEKNNIRLIRIPYTQFDEINSILETHLKRRVIA